MIISKTPYRISFVGGGSDMAVFYRESPGAVVSTTINKYMYVTVNRRFEPTIRMAYTETEIVESVKQLQHELAREAIKMTGLNASLEITTIGEVPAGTGLGSSSAVTVGLLNALWTHQGIKKSCTELAQQACAIEIDILKEPIGKQDQYAAGFGGLNYIQFKPDETVQVEPIKCLKKTKQSLDENLLLFYTGIKRQASKILKEQTHNTKKQTDKKKILGKMVELAQELKYALEKNDLSRFGMLLDENWQLKKRMASKITNPKIDYWYEQAKKAGAIGGKILGAGGGGFLLLYCLKDQQSGLKTKMTESGLRELKFSLESQGSMIFRI